MRYIEWIKDQFRNGCGRQLVRQRRPLNALVRLVDLPVSVVVLKINTVECVRGLPDSSAARPDVDDVGILGVRRNGIDGAGHRVTKETGHLTARNWSGTLRIPCRRWPRDQRPRKQTGSVVEFARPAVNNQRLEVGEEIRSQGIPNSIIPLLYRTDSELSAVRRSLPSSANRRMGTLPPTKLGNGFRSTLSSPAPVPTVK